MKRLGCFLLPAVLGLWMGQVDVSAQWSGANGITLHRGQIAHTLFNPGMSGRKDDERKQSPASFSYPMGRALKVYSGGSIRDGWNARSNTGGEGVWVLSKTGGTVQGSYAGARVMSSDVQMSTINLASEPEAYLGAVHNPDWALASVTSSGREAAWTDGVALYNARQTYWPSSSGVAGRSPSSFEPVTIWNFRFGRYNSTQSYDERSSAGEFSTALGPPAWASALSEDAFPETVGITRASSSTTGLQWTRKWYQWGHTDYDDFVINETIVENGSSTTQEGVYIVLTNRLMSGAAVNWRSTTSWNKTDDWARDDHVRSTMAANYMTGETRASFVDGGGKPAGAQAGKDLADAGHAMIYVHDGESAHADNPHADVGDPFQYNLAVERYTNDQTWISEGHIQHGQYFGLGVVDAIPPFNTYGGVDSETYVAPSDNAATSHDESQKQPASISMWRYIDTSTFDQPSPTKDSDTLIYDTITQAGYMDEPGDVYAYNQVVAFGPYTLAPGEKCKVVVAYVGGMAASAPKYADYKQYAEPFNLAWMNLYNGPGQSLTTFADRQEEIPLGEDVLFTHFQNAINAYNWGYDIPNQPPNIKMGYKNNLDGKTEIYWSSFGEDAADPDYTGTEASDLRGYRIYKSTTEYQGPWEFVTEVSFDDIRAENLPSQLRFDATYVFHTVPDGNNPDGIPLRENKFMSGLDEAAGATIPGTYFFVDDASEPNQTAWYAVRYYDSGHSDWKGTGRTIAVLESASGPSGGAIIGGRTGIAPQIPIVFRDIGSAQVDSIFYPQRSMGETWAQTLTLSNQSNYAVEVRDASPETDAFVVSPTSFSIPSKGTGEVTVTFSGQGSDEIFDALTIESTGGTYSLALVSTSLPGVISTLSGGGNESFNNFRADTDAKEATLSSPKGVVADSVGNIYVTAGEYDVIFKIDAAGIISVIAGDEPFPRFSTQSNYSADGVPATESKLGDPFGIALDRNGNLYIADRANHRVRKIDASGVISTIAGNGVEGHSGDGAAATEAMLDAPFDVAIGPSDEVYVSVEGAVRKIDAGGMISTVAGKAPSDDLSSGAVLGDNGPATEASITPAGIFVDGADNLYIADQDNHRIRKVNKDGVISTIAGDGFADPITKAGRFAGDGGTATMASLYSPRDVAMDGNGDLYIADGLNNCIRKVSLSGSISTVVGKGESGLLFNNYSGDGGAAQGAGLVAPLFLTIGSNGDILITTNSRRLRKIENLAVAPPPGGFVPVETPAEPSPDFNGDGAVNFSDFLGFAGHFGTKAGEDGFDSLYDLNQDGEVGFADFLVFASAFGQ